MKGELHVRNDLLVNVMMRVFCVLIFTALACNPQDSRQPSPDPEIIRLQGLPDQLKDALGAADIATANWLAKELGLGVSRREKALRVTALEIEVPATGPMRVHGISKVAL